MYVNKSTGWVEVQQMYIPTDISDETLGTAASQTGWHSRINTSQIINTNDTFEVFSTPNSHNTLELFSFLVLFFYCIKRIVRMFNLYPFSILIVCSLSIFHIHYTLTKFRGQCSKHSSSKPDISRQANSSDTKYKEMSKWANRTHWHVKWSSHTSGIKIRFQ